MIHHSRRPLAGSETRQIALSSVQAPGLLQHKRPRRRCAEHEKMYTCAWNGCDKTYDTLSHLNGHVMMQSHGPKQTSKEFKGTRYKWKG